MGRGTNRVRRRETGTWAPLLCNLTLWEEGVGWGGKQSSGGTAGEPPI